MKKKMSIVLCGLIALFSLTSYASVHAEGMGIWGDIPERAPIIYMESNQYGMVSYEYQLGNRVTKSSSDFVVTYEYDDAGNMIRENGTYGCIEYIIESINDSDYYIGFKYSDEIYYYIYDELGSVVELLNANGQEVCKYSYNLPNQIVYECVNGVWVENTSLDFIGNINPIRYQGWYYDFDTNCYYTGKGIFYCISSEEFIMNDIVLPASKARADISAAMSLYVDCMNSSSFNSQRYQVSEAEWNEGKRWYDNLSDTEICARCIMGENVYDAKTDDRTAIAYVIANRINNQYQGTSLRTVLTNPNKFTSISKSYYDGGNEAALAMRSPSSSKWQQCVKLACILTYTTQFAHINSVYPVPAGISDQLHFYSVSVLRNSSSFTVSNGKLYQNGNELEDVAIAGVGLLTIPSNTTSKAFLDDYTFNNLFYNYK